MEVAKAVLITFDWCAIGCAIATLITTLIDPGMYRIRHQVLLSMMALAQVGVLVLDLVAMHGWVKLVAGIPFGGGCYAAYGAYRMHHAERLRIAERIARELTKTPALYD